MRVILTGATGFIGRHIARALIAAGHHVDGGARNRDEAFRRYPGMGWFKADFATDHTSAVWEQRLCTHDEVVINAAGILRERGRASFEAVHFDAPKALFQACAVRRVRKVIHISALGCDAASRRPYEETKLRIEQYLATLNLDWVVLRPSLVYGEDSPSSRLFRFLAGLPVIPLIGDGGQLLQPMHVDDLAAAVVRLLEPRAPSRMVLELGGPRPVTYREFLAGLRASIHGSPARFVSVPPALARVGARMADLVGVGPIGTDTINMLMRGNFTSVNAAPLLLRREPRNVAELARTGRDLAGTGPLHTKVS